MVFVRDKCKYHCSCYDSADRAGGVDTAADADLFREVAVGDIDIHLKLARAPARVCCDLRCSFVGRGKGTALAALVKMLLDCGGGWDGGASVKVEGYEILDNFTVIFHHERDPF